MAEVELSQIGFYGIAGGECIPEGTLRQRAKIASVPDGDTVEVQLDNELMTIKYTGIQAPELTEALGAFSRDANFKLVAGEELLLIKDDSIEDQPDNLFRYVFVGDIFVNYYMLQNGYARTSADATITNCSAEFTQAEQSAREESKGIWAIEPSQPEPTQTEPVESTVEGNELEISEIQAVGVVNESEPDEYVEIHKIMEQIVTLEGWQLHNEDEVVFVFPYYAMRPGQLCRVYTNEDHAEWCGFNVKQADSGIWRNDTDCVYLYNQAGELVAQECY